MTRRIGFCAILAATALLAVAATVLAGGVVVTLDADPPRVEAGQSFQIGFTIISMHEGNQLQDGLAPHVTAIHSETGQIITTTALSDGAPGHYVATLTLPTAGAWQWQVQPFGSGTNDFPASEFTPIQISESEAGAGRSDLDQVLAGQWWPAALALALALPLTAAWLRSRRRVAEAR